MMAARIIDGKAIAAEIRAGIKDKSLLFTGQQWPSAGVGSDSGR